MIFSNNLARATVFLVVVSWMPAVGSAQLSENEVAQFLPAKSVLVVSFNMEAILESLDEEAAILNKFRQRQSASLLDFTEIKQRLIVVFSSELDEITPLDFPLVTFDRYPDEVAREKILESANKQNPELVLYEPTTLDGVDLLVGKYQMDFGGMSLSESAFYFPKADMVGSGSLPVIKELLGEQSQDAEGAEFTIDLDLEAEFHLILESGKNLTQISEVATILNMLASDMQIPIPDGGSLIEMVEALDRLEIIFDADRMTPFQASLKFNSEETAEQVEQLINAGMQTLPALFTMLESEPLPEEMKDDLNLFLNLAKQSHQELKVERAGDAIDISLSGVEGLDKLPAHVARFSMQQQINIDKLKQEFGDIEVELSVDDDDR